ncbi:ALPHA/BETA-HYDROLASES SUPERFAMILY PROTEIN [Salix koriyanagi]|uniref:ALPHA/BETA-HYDROLASES SUPERFAMILY PROTEIN n=2 Tax=Salix TaxID=40685 RepID=A0A9Q0PVZ3_9ROSI|nr:ALPHA/BETA-HYDROLASES SUPERFAMILY PROTEIN [Salix koriyanagi]
MVVMLSDIAIRNNAHHRRSVAASLVQGVRVLERDRQVKRRGSQALAPPWWEFFHFQLHRQLVDDVDSSIFGAIYEFKPPESHYDKSVVESPCYVIAFRGTITKPGSVQRDLELDMSIIRNRLHETSRFETAIQAVRNVVATAGESNVWLAGHSLGAATALLAGKTMAKTGIFLQAFLFNSPFISAPIERIKDKRVKHGLRIASSVITAGLAFTTKKKSSQNSRSVDPFATLSAWIPFLFVNPG